MANFTRIRVYPTVDKTLPSFDNTKLVAINTCPFWGIVRYSKHKTLEGTGRAMALEAGGAAHEVFAAHRLHHILQHGMDAYGVDAATNSRAFERAGIRIFGEKRLEEMLGAIDSREDSRAQRIAFSLTALYNSGFYDDPSDKRRTTTNIEEMAIAYMDKFDWSKQMPYIHDINSQNPFIGIEIPVDVTIEFTLETGEVRAYRFIGKADAIHYKDDTLSTLRVHENKTASRLGDAWEASWNTNHQPTGYMVALSTLFNTSIDHGLILGSALPMPKSYALNGVSRVPITREDWQIVEWFKWFYHTVELHDQYIDDVVNAPQYTHSCNRYFRSCSFIPLCASPPDERQEMIAEMQEDEWSPLEDEGSAD